MKPPRPLLYLISDRRAFRPSPETDLSQWQAQLSAIALAAQSGCQLIQIREKDVSARMLTTFTRAAIAAARPWGAKVLVNDRLDVALAAGADGVHLRVNSLPATDVCRAISRSDFLVAVSTHSLAQAQAAEKAGADFIVCGPVYDTPSKREFGAPLGLARFAEICRAVSIPVLALGGISLQNVREPLAHGAAGVAAISLFTDRENLPAHVHQLLHTEF